MNKKYRELAAACEREDDRTTLSLELYIISKQILNRGLPKLDKIFPSQLSSFQDLYLKKMINEKCIEKSTYKKTYPRLRTYLVYGYKETVTNTVDPILYPYFLDILEKLRE